MVLFILCAALVAACGGARIRPDDAAAAAGLTKAVVRGAAFEHSTYSGDGSTARAPVWVYIEGDGVPWTDEIIPADDPTPRALVAFSMMIEGPRPAVYLGRPCYFDARRDARCEPVWWTHRRFGPEVIDSMVTALRRIVDARGWSGRRINLVGFSGGGTLATLMASQIDELCALVTLASPLDVDEWSASRGFSPLAGSANPALRAPLPAAVRQLHLRGERDRTVPPDNGAAYLRGNPAAEVRLVANVGHGDEWVAVWRTFLAESTGTVIAGCK